VLAFEEMMRNRKLCSEGEWEVCDNLTAALQLAWRLYHEQ
jgi:hypothetical protein